MDILTKYQKRINGDDDDEENPPSHQPISLIRDTTSTPSDYALMAVYSTVAIIGFYITEKITAIWDKDVMFLAFLVLLSVLWQMAREIPERAVMHHPQRSFSNAIMNMFAIPSNLLLQLSIQYAITMLSSSFVTADVLSASEGALIVFTIIVATILLATQSQIDAKKHERLKEQIAKRKAEKAAAKDKLGRLSTVVSRFMPNPRQDPLSRLL